MVLVDKRPARITPPMADHEQLEYDLSDFTAERREAVTFWLVTSEIPFEWEPDGLLVVPSKWQLEVDAIIESMEHPDAGRAGEVGAYPAEMIDAGPAELASPARRLAGFLIDYVVITAVAVIADRDLRCAQRGRHRVGGAGQHRVRGGRHRDLGPHRREAGRAH